MGRLTIDATPRPRADLIVVELDGEAVVYDEASGSLHQLNRSATVVWGLCDGRTTVDVIAADVADTFGLPIEEILPQVLDTIETFAGAELLEG